MKKVALLFILVLLIPLTASAQIITPAEDEGAEPEGIGYSILPVAGYTTDLGLFGGIILQRVNYGAGVKPFLSTIRLDVNASTRGRLVGKAEYEQINLFDRPIRNRTLFEAIRDPQHTFYGIGNNSPYTKEGFEEGDFFYRQNHILTVFTARKKLVDLGEEGSFNAVTRFKISYTEAAEIENDTQFAIEQPNGFDGGWVNTFGVGLMAESRNSEFLPTKGIRMEVGANYSSGRLFGSSYSFNDYFLDARSYFTPWLDITLAHRIELRYATDDAPFWEKPVIGNERGLRGYALNRFIGDASVLNMIELRKWLFSVLDDEIRFGGHLFFDSGRVYSDMDSNRIFEEWNHTVGFGGAISLFNPDLFLRGEIGFTDEDYRIYAGVGYAF